MKLAYGIAYVDPTATLSEEHKKAAAVAGYGIPFISEETKYLMRLAEQRSQSQLPQRDVK